MSKKQSDDILIQNYLDKLYLCLGDSFGLEQRQEIIKEIRSHILVLQEQKNELPIQKIFENLGTPEELAARYKQESTLVENKSGQQFNLKSKHKVLVFCALLLVAGIVIPLGFMNSKFNFLDKKDRPFFQGHESIDPSHSKSLVFTFTNGKLFFKQGIDNEMSWKCRGSRPADLGLMKQGTEFYWKMPQASCVIKVPKFIPISIRGVSGKIFFNTIMNPVDLEIKEGKVNFSPHPDGKYKWEIIGHGPEDSQFATSNDADAFLIRMNLQNGRIQHTVKLNEENLDE